MLDAILMEQAGVPAVAIVTDVFRETGAAMAASWGMAGYRFLHTPHPIANLVDQELAARAAALVEAVTALLAT